MVKLKTIVLFLKIIAYFMKEIDLNELLSNQNKKVCTTLNYIEHFLTLVYAVTVCISISTFATLTDFSKGITSFTIGLNIYAIISRIKEYISIIKKKKKKHEKKEKPGRIMILSNRAVCDSKKSKFIKEQEASRLLSTLGIKAPLSKIPLVGRLSF